MLALPIGHIYDTEYERRWVPDDLYFHMRQFPETYKGKQVIWIYVDMDAKTSLPFRVAYIEEINPTEDILFIKFRLDNYKCLKNVDKLSEKTTALFRRYFGDKNIPPGGKFILPGEDSIFSEFELERDQCVPAEPELLRQYIVHLLSNKKMKKSLFYKITTDGLVQKKKDKKNPTTIYKIRGGKSFKIKLDYFLPNYEEFDEHNPEERTIYFQSSNRKIEPVGESKIVLSKYGYEELEFITDKVFVKKIVSLVFWSKHDEFHAAKPILQIHLLPTKFKNAVSSMVRSILLLIMTGALALAAQTYSSEQSLWGAFWTSIKKFIVAVKAENILLNIIFLVFLCGIFFSLSYFYPRGTDFKK